MPTEFHVCSKDAFREAVIGLQALEKQLGLVGPKRNRPSKIQWLPWAQKRTAAKETRQYRRTESNLLDICLVV
jgi:hypothetical protein